MVRIKSALEGLLDDLRAELTLKRELHQTVTADIDRLERQQGVVLELIGREEVVAA